MSIFNKKEALILFVGDILIFLASLWVTLFLRYRGVEDQLFFLHLEAFSFLFLIWVISFFIAGLYEKQTLILKNRLPQLIFRTQILNSVIGIIFFYFIPYFNIAPKRNLFLYLLVSIILESVWRIYLFPLFALSKRQKALLVAGGKEMEFLKKEVNENSRYNLIFTSHVDLGKPDASLEAHILENVYADSVGTVVLDLNNEKIKPILPHLYNLIFSRMVFIQFHKVYEDVFDRVPLSSLSYEWFLENISLSPKTVYDFLKRLMDMLLAFSLGILTLPFYPLVWLALFLEDRGSLFITQKRIGQHNNPVTLWKFRTMMINDDGEYSKGRENKVTKVGNFLRKTRIDEFPQFWNVLKGDLSLIGPRPELPELVRHYEGEIPYYSIRHMIKPGLSGWAQIYHDEHPHHGIAIDETRDKLSYDLFYVKNRSFLLDLKIALKTLKVLLGRKGR